MAKITKAQLNSGNFIFLLENLNKKLIIRQVDTLDQVYIDIRWYIKFNDMPEFIPSKKGIMMTKPEWIKVVLPALLQFLDITKDDISND